MQANPFTNYWRMHWQLICIVLLLGAYNIGCEHDDDSPAPVVENTDSTDTSRNTNQKSATGEEIPIPFNTLSTETEFVESFRTELRSLGDLINLYSRNTLRPPPVNTPQWDSVNFDTETVIYISIGETTEPLIQQVRSVVKTESNLIVGLNIGHTLIDCPLVATNYPGHVVSLPRFDLPIIYREVQDTILICY